METIKAMLGGGGSGDGEEGQIQIPKDGDMPSRDEMMKTIESLQKAQKATSAAVTLRDKAKAMTSSTQREKMLKEAFDKEMEANGHSKMAKRLQSGSWQGFGFGGGIGAATGLGLGSGIGILLGAITAVPATGIGMLVGTGVGAIHGPFVKLGGKDGKTEEVPFEDADTGRVVDAMEKERKARLENGAAEDGECGKADSGAAGTGDKPRRKPPKIEIRNKKYEQTETGDKAENEPEIKKEANVTTSVSDESKPAKRKPKKLEIRSGNKAGTAKA